MTVQIKLTIVTVLLLLIFGCAQPAQQPAESVSEESVQSLPIEETAAPITATEATQTKAAEPQAELEIQNLYWYESKPLNTPFLHIFGEVKNLGKVPVKFVEVEMTFNRKDKTPGTSKQLLKVEQLEPGMKGPFAATIENFSKPAEVEAKISNYKIVEQSIDQVLEVSGAHLEFKGGYTQLKGTVTNTSATETKTAWVVATFYNGAGKVVETGVEAFPNIKPKESKPFMITVGTAPETVASFATEFSS